MYSTQPVMSKCDESVHDGKERKKEVNLYIGSFWANEILLIDVIFSELKWNEIHIFIFM